MTKQEYTKTPDTQPTQGPPTRFYAERREETWWDGTKVVRVTCALDLGNGLGVGFLNVDAGAEVDERELRDYTLLALEQKIGEHMAYWMAMP